jgi:hypothetical protein
MSLSNYNFSEIYYYTGNSQNITLQPSIYQFECWGAQGGASAIGGAIGRSGGLGSYSSGILILKDKTTFYLYIGGEGKVSTTTSGGIGGFNGGGTGGTDLSDSSAPESGGGGGGATDIRTIQGDTTSRIIVAGGGSGGSCYSYGAPGGDLHGYIMTEIDNINAYTISNTNQTHGNENGIGSDGGNNLF